MSRRWPRRPKLWSSGRARCRLHRAIVERSKNLGDWLRRASRIGLEVFESREHRVAEVSRTIVVEPRVPRVEELSHHQVERHQQNDHTLTISTCHGGVRPSDERSGRGRRCARTQGHGATSTTPRTGPTGTVANRARYVNRPLGPPVCQAATRSATLSTALLARVLSQQECQSSPFARRTVTTWLPRAAPFVSGLNSFNDTGCLRRGGLSHERFSPGQPRCYRRDPKGRRAIARC